MAYDPQAGRRRPSPDTETPAPVDAILGSSNTGSAAAGATPSSAGVADDPPPIPAVTPHPADPPSDKLLLNTGLAAAIGSIVALLTLRHLWQRHRRRAASDE